MIIILFMLKIFNMLCEVKQKTKRTLVLYTDVVILKICYIKEAINLKL